MPALDQYEKAVFCNISIFLCIFFRRALILLFCISQWIDEYDYDYGDDENDDDESNEKMILIVIMVMMRTMTMIVILIILTVLRGKMLSQLQNSFFLLNRNSGPFSNLKNIVNWLPPSWFLKLKKCLWNYLHRMNWSFRVAQFKNNPQTSLCEHKLW